MKFRWPKPCLVAQHFLLNTQQSKFSPSRVLKLYFFPAVWENLTVREIYRSSVTVVKQKASWVAPHRVTLPQKCGGQIHWEKKLCSVVIELR